ncbi:MAG: iron-containing alcohol dehydrogenase [Eubacteriales bacterium]|nr:iron-containing alcohol dehydrogenase [Eubacteriales bacterium]
MDFDFYTAGKIVFGCGRRKEIGREAARLGAHKVLIVAGRSQKEAAAQIARDCAAEGVGVSFCLCAGGEPTVTSVDESAAVARETGADCLIGIGGGSCIDTAKAAAALAVNGGSVREYLEGVGTGRRITAVPLPFIAVPTTSGTGAEVTKNAVVMSREENFKKSFRDERMLARVALVDPELTVGVPKAVTASTGMDAVTQLIESYISAKARPMTDALSLYALKGAPDALRRSYDDGTDLEARTAMARCSLFSGIALANSGLGAAHGVAAGLGALYGVPHGVACAMLLPHTMRYNLRAGGTKLADVGRTLTGRTFGSDAAAAAAGADCIAELSAYLSIPSSLSDVGVREEDLPSLAKASLGSSMKGNPVPMDESAVLAFLRSIYA